MADPPTPIPTRSCYPLRRVYWAYQALVFATLAVVALMAWTDPRWQGFGRALLTIWTMGLIFALLKSLLWLPYRIDLDDQGIQFIARTRSVDVRWSELQMVSRSVFGGQFAWITWVWDGGRVNTTRMHARIDEVIDRVRIYAPHTELRRL